MIVWFIFSNTKVVVFFDMTKSLCLKVRIFKDYLRFAGNNGVAEPLQYGLSHPGWNDRMVKCEKLEKLGPGVILNGFPMRYKDVIILHIIYALT